MDLSKRFEEISERCVHYATNPISPEDIDTLKMEISDLIRDIESFEGDFRDLEILASDLEDEKTQLEDDLDDLQKRVNSARSYLE